MVEGYSAGSVTQKLRIIDYILDDRSFKPFQPLNSGSQPVRSLGQLDELPLELLSDVFLEMDVPTLVAFRHVNRRAMALIDSLYQYRRVMAYCADIVHAIIATKVSSFTFNTLYYTLTISDCANCGRFGGYLYLITCDRVCYFCFSREAPYLPVTESAACRVGLSKNYLDQLPHILSLPGHYTANKKISKKSIKLFDRATIQQRSQHTRWAAMVDRHLDYTTREPKRYMAIISAPHFNLDRDVDWGVHCLGCRDIDEPTRHLRFKYSQAAILDHFKQYGPVQKSQGRLQHVQHHSV